MLTGAKERSEIVIDTVSEDQVLSAGYSVEGTKQARRMVESFQAFLEENRDEITALQILLSQPYGQQRVTYAQIKELAAAIEHPPRVWTTEALWEAYAQLRRDKARGAC